MPGVNATTNNWNAGEEAGALPKKSGLLKVRLPVA